MTWNCSPWAWIQQGEYATQNNVWNVSGINYTQCIQFNHWRWHVNANDPSKIRTYPETIFGKKPWSAASTTPKLPKQLPSVYDMDVDFSWQFISAQGLYNVSLDMWICDNVNCSQSDISDEVMVWLWYNGLTPAGEYKTTVTLEGYTWDFWSDGFTHTVKATSKIMANKIRVGEMLRQMAIHGILSATNYLASVEMGTEIAGGSGEFRINKFNVLNT